MKLKNIKDGERELFEFLLQVIQKYKLSTVLRVAGGWVRDKLLGRDSDDIDIAIDDMTGVQFAKYITEYRKSKDGLNTSVAIIKANPEQSKHLETATIKLGTGWIDFVNLRAETYSSDSRIPHMEFGTPSQDAIRRDFTINSLFYNINTGNIEDFTEKERILPFVGMEDLKNGMIRTPMPPSITFIDDPIRALRAIRFASRFQFNLEDSLLESMESKQIQDALIHKISRERVGKELIGMLTGSRARPGTALGLIHRHGLSGCIFQTPDTICHEDGRDADIHENAWKESNECVQKMQQLIDTSHKNEVCAYGVRIRMLAAALVPFAGLFMKSKKNKLMHLPSYIVQTSLKLPAIDAKNVSTTLKNFPKFQSLAKVKKDRASAGLLLRSVGSIWHTVHDVGIVHDAYTSEKSILQVTSKYDELRTYFEHEKLLDVWNMKPIVNGMELINELKLKKGPIVSKYSEATINWQLDNPKGTKSDCLTFLKTLQF